MKYTIPYLIPGLNGPDGLIRQHFHAAKKAKDKLLIYVFSQKVLGYITPVPCRIVYTRYASRPLDLDNAAASVKHLLDAVVGAGVLVDDSPQFVAELVVKQVKCKKSEERTIFEIEAI